MSTEVQAEPVEQGKAFKKRPFFLSHKKSSALVVTIILHALFIVAAVTLVVAKALHQPKADFVATTVERPQPKLKRLEVPVKENKKKAPKLREMIVTKPNVAVSLVMPQMVGIKGGAGFENGTGLGSMGLGFDLDLFGANRGSGNEFVGTLYDLKMDEDGDPTDMNTSEYFEELGRFCGSWNPRRLDDYFRAPKQKYASSFFFPEIDANEAPKAFGVDGIVKPELWVIHYVGAIKAPESGEYRFVGYGDDVLIVQVGSKNVLQGNWDDRKAIKWESDDDADQQYKIFGSRPLFVGDWFDLDKGREVPVNILIGECSGNKFACALLIEKRGEDYSRSSSGGPLLPLFKTTEISSEIISKMRVNRNEATTDGPLFGVLINE